jgi:hypothetical protein
LNGPDCLFKTNAEGGIRLIFKQELAVPQLASDYNYVSLDFKLPCNNPYKTKDVRASGEIFGLTIFYLPYLYL